MIDYRVRSISLTTLVGNQFLPIVGLGDIRGAQVVEVELTGNALWILASTLKLKRSRSGHAKIVLQLLQ
ncbi:hypothetical protein E2C01_049909 [Portunus trituberculatus]|uniref:Uncharacterized protein n=1 Tax=Portunus trituberculatus TaxID=210409 RepID=A0A5B7G7L9_PORTR|nr:hypothetical protein [Portunus trituberculatus]